jgi:hypothetical protein
VCITSLLAEKRADHARFSTNARMISTVDFGDPWSFHYPAQNGHFPFVLADAELAT